ncbi:MAG: DsbA family protein [Arenibacterium sp.]
MRRRDALIAAAAVISVVTAPRLIERFRDEFAFEPMPRLPGFRRLQTGSVSSLDPALIGVDAPSPQQIEMRHLALQGPCNAVFGPLPEDGAVPVAVFTDYNCPFCPQASEEIVELVAEGAPVRISWHDYPVLGPRSEAAARVAIAAGKQGAYAPVHLHLMRSVLKPGPRAIRRLAEDFGLDPEQLAEDAESPETTVELERTKAAASVFGLFGTPSIIVGHTVVVGHLRKQSMKKLIEMEHNIPPQRRICAT